MTTEILLQGERLLLLPERAVWWPAQKTLLVADVHWGKSAHFRKHGIPMPGGTQDRDSLRLAQIIREYGAARLVVAGDLFHSRHNSEVADFGRWRAAQAGLHIDFVIGNHDILDRALYEEWKLEVHAAGLSLGPFYITHDQSPHTDLYTIHGHIHPGIRISGPGRQGLTLPCFGINADCMVLPAFSEFTGRKLVQPGDYSRIYVIGEGKVLQLK